MATQLTAAIYALPVPTPAPQVDTLDGDTIDFDHWLLPAAQAGTGERVVRALSVAAGPLALIAGLAVVSAPFWG